MSLKDFKNEKKAVILPEGKGQIVGVYLPGSHEETLLIQLENKEIKTVLKSEIKE